MRKEAKKSTGGAAGAMRAGGKLDLDEGRLVFALQERMGPDGYGFVPRIDLHGVRDEVLSLVMAGGDPLVRGGYLWLVGSGSGFDEQWGRVSIPLFEIAGGVEITETVAREGAVFPVARKNIDTGARKAVLHIEYAITTTPQRPDQFRSAAYWHVTTHDLDLFPRPFVKEATSEDTIILDDLEQEGPFYRWFNAKGFWDAEQPASVSWNAASRNAHMLGSVTAPPGEFVRARLEVSNYVAEYLVVYAEHLYAAPGSNPPPFLSRPLILKVV